MEPFWIAVNEPTLRQGDWLPRCLVPTFGPQFVADGSPQEMAAHEFDLIVVTQSCDLEQRKVRLVACIPIFGVAEFEATNPAFARKGRWNDVLKGRVEGPARARVIASGVVTRGDSNRSRIVTPVVMTAAAVSK